MLYMIKDGLSRDYPWYNMNFNYTIDNLWIACRIVNAVGNQSNLFLKDSSLEQD